MHTFDQKRQKRKLFVQHLYEDAADAGLTVPQLLRRRQIKRAFGLAGLAAAGFCAAHFLDIDLSPLWLALPPIGTLTTDNIAYGTYTAMTVTNLQSLAIDTTDPFAGWQSARVDNFTTTKADDFEIQILLSTAATAPANDQAVYVYLVPWIIDGSSAWTPAANFGTTTRPTGSEATASMSDPNSMKGPIALPYKITSQPIDGFFTVGQMCAGVVPDGWSLALRNNCGAALGTGCVVAYRPITYTNQ